MVNCSKPMGQKTIIIILTILYYNNIFMLYLISFHKLVELVEDQYKMVSCSKSRCQKLILDQS